MTRRGALILLGGGTVAIVAGALSWAPPLSISYNPSPSAPRGFYRLTAYAGEAMPMLGDRIMLYPPASAARLAAERDYVPVSVPLLKSVRAVSGMRLCRTGAAVTIDGRLAAIAMMRDRAGRPLPAWRGCRRLAAAELFVLGDRADSWDGRYFGIVPRAAVIARAVPLWTW